MAQSHSPVSTLTFALKTMSQMTEKDLNDMQGLIKRGFSDKAFSNLLLLKIDDAPKAKKWLKSILPTISTGLTKGTTLDINVAFTYLGLKALQLPEKLVKKFSREFEEGMSEESRTRLLGDYDRETLKSRVPEWDWQDGESPNAVHLMLLIYGNEEHLVEEYCSALALCYPDNGLSDGRKLVTIKLPDSREHFGFRDGLAQPYIKEFGERPEPASNTIALGEFVLGYPNQYGKLTESPAIKDPKTNMELDFGKNGTYLVMRQLEQKVKEFWNFMADHSKDAEGNVNMHDAVALATQMVGRWPSGAPLICAPDKSTDEMAEKNDFLYEFHKPENFGRCPMGAHIVRANPRDALSENKDEGLTAANNHRLLRRGRSYGRPFITSMTPEEIFTKANDDDEERGLHFICLNANIARQFEFVQSTWLNNVKFAGFYNNGDPIAGTNTNDFTIKQKPVSRHFKDIPAFIKVRGGGYFFLPSLTALQYLTEN
jgi:Dyp-type peroxidase family